MKRGISVQQPPVFSDMLEDLWRERAKRAAYRYRQDADRLTDVLAVHPPYARIEADGAFAIRTARQRSLDSRKEYLRVLRVFVDLVTHGILPGEDPNSDRSAAAKPHE